MERLLNSLERRFGRYAFDNLTLVLVGAQAAAFVLNMAKPGFTSMLVLDPYAVQAGQYWRLFTYIFVPPNMSPIWVLFALYFLHTMGTALEEQWGAFKYQSFWMIGMLATAGYAFAFRVPADNQYLMTSLFLAFATLWPKYEILLFFILPVQVRWLAILAGLQLVWSVITLSGWGKLIPVVAVANYLLFFGEPLFQLLRGRAYQATRGVAGKERHRKEIEKPRVRSCAMCGLTSEQDPDMDFRVCTCEKHDGKPTELCLPHARNH